jgi:FtsZ-interacting cell division protein ZipA
MKDLEAMVIVVGVTFVVVVIFVQLHSSYKKGKKNEQSKNSNTKRFW